MDPEAVNPERLLADTRWLQRVARQLVQNPWLADDLAQDTWLDALRYRGRAILDRRAWLRSLLVHRLSGERRRQASREDRERAAACGEALPSTAELCQRAELQRVLSAALLALDEPYRTTALLRFLEGLAPVEIAARLGLPANTVRWRLRRVVERLRERLGEELGDGERDWRPALLPLAGLEVASSSAAPFLGALVTKHVLTAVALVALTALGGYALARALRSPVRDARAPLAAAELAPPPEAPAVDEVASVEPPSARSALPGADETPATAVAPQGTVLFVARAREDGRTLPGVEVRPEVRGAALAPAADEPARSDASGELPRRVPANEVLHVQAWGTEPAAGLAVLDVAPLAPGEVRRVELLLPTAVDLVVRGRVLDETTGLPVAGARVASLHPSGLVEAVEDADTAADGRFELRTPSWILTFVEVTAAGHGRVYFRPDAAHATLADEATIRLPRAAACEGRVSLDEPGLDVRVELTTPFRELLRPAVEEPRLTTRVDPCSAPVGPDGTYRVEGLNAGAPYTARLLVGERPPRLHPEPLVLAPGEVRRLDWTLEESGRVEGRLVDQHGEPVAGAELWLLPDEDGQARELASWEARSARTLRTDEDGSFAVENVATGGWRLGPAAREGASLYPWSEPLRVARGETARIELRTWRDLALRGRVVDPDGRPVPGVSLTVDGPSRLRPRTDGDGRFRLTGLGDEDYVLSAGGMDEGYARSDPVTARPAEDPDELVLEVRPGGAIRGRVVAERLADVDGMIVVSARSPRSEEDAWVEIAVRVDGYFGVDGLEPGTYDLFLDAGDGRVGFLPGIEVEAGARVDELELHLQEGARVELVPPPGVPWLAYTLRSGDALLAEGTLGSGETSTVTVPEGPLEVRWDDGDGEREPVAVTATRGVPVRVQLR